MQAYEFNSAIGNDGIIRVPEQYLGNISSPVKVILLVDSNEETHKNRSGCFSAMKLKTKGFRFDRDAANE